MTTFRPRLRRAWRRLSDEDGSITVDFVILAPLFLTILFASFEAGYANMRQVMLERALDITVRDLRVGALGNQPTHQVVRNRFCDLATLMPNCQTELLLEMRVIDRTTWTGFATAPTCVNRLVAVQPALAFTQGGSNQLVTIRACAVFDPFFPTTKWGLQLQRDASGGYQMAAMSAFVNEPRVGGGGT
jgi:Flp pilus assembly protein TadG